MNAGCTLTMNARLPANEPLHVRARLEAIDDDGARAIVIQRVITGTKSAPEAVVADLRAYVPLATTKGDKPRPTREGVPLDAHELAALRLSSDAGLDFAKLTGDFNPIHWVPAYARASGFRTCILHGFSTFARAIEALNRARFAGDASRLHRIDARFSRPLGLPARVFVYAKNDALWVADGVSARPYLEGTIQSRTI
jgi:hypothetical protein